MGWQEDPVIGNWGLRRGKRTGRRPYPQSAEQAQPVVGQPDQPMDQPQMPPIESPQGQQPQGIQQAAPQSPPVAEPTQQQQPERPVKFGDRIYRFPMDWSRDSVARWLNMNVARKQREGTELDFERAKGMSLYDDPETHIQMRRQVPLGKAGRTEYAKHIKHRVGKDRLDMTADEITPQVLEKYIASRKRVSETKSPRERREWDEDTAAMERDLHRVWDNETVADYEKRMKAMSAVPPPQQTGAAQPQVDYSAEADRAEQMPIPPSHTFAQESTAQPLPGAGTRVENQDGTFSTERTIGVNIDGREYVIPTLVDGKQLDEQTAVNEAKRRGLQNYPSFNTVEEAEQYAQGRSAAIGGAQPPAQAPVAQPQVTEQPPEQPPVTTEAGSEEAGPQSVWDAFRRSVASVQAHNPQGSMQIQPTPEEQATDQDKPPQREPLSMTFEAMDLSGEINPIHEPGMYALQQSGMKSIDSFPDVGSGALQQRGFDVTDPFPHAAQGQRIPVARSKSEMEKLEKIVPDGSFFWVMDDKSKKAAKIPGKGAVPRRRARGNQPSPAPESGQRHTTAPVRYGIGGGSTPRGI